MTLLELKRMIEDVEADLDISAENELDDIEVVLASKGKFHCLFEYTIDNTHVTRLEDRKVYLVEDDRVGYLDSDVLKDLDRRN